MPDELRGSLEAVRRSTRRATGTSRATASKSGRISTACAQALWHWLREGDSLRPRLRAPLRPGDRRRTRRRRRCRADATARRSRFTAVRPALRRTADGSTAPTWSSRSRSGATATSIEDEQKQMDARPAGNGAAAQPDFRYRAGATIAHRSGHERGPARDPHAGTIADDDELDRVRRFLPSGRRLAATPSTAARRSACESRRAALQRDEPFALLHRRRGGCALMPPTPLAARRTASPCACTATATATASCSHFPRPGGGEPYYVLIDCGYKPGSHRTSFDQTAVDRRRREAPAAPRAAGTLDLVILTHEHQDHLNGIWKQTKPLLRGLRDRGGVGCLDGGSRQRASPTSCAKRHKDQLLGLLGARRELALAVGEDDPRSRALDSAARPRAWRRRRHSSTAAMLAAA